jgi:hypothetical protein
MTQSSFPWQCFCFCFNKFPISVTHDKLVRTCFLMIHNSDSTCIHKMWTAWQALQFPRQILLITLAGTSTCVAILWQCGRHIVDILKHEARMSNISEFISYYTENTVRFHFYDQLVNGVQRNNRCLLWALYEMYQYRVWWGKKSRFFKYWYRRHKVTIFAV